MDRTAILSSSCWGSDQFPWERKLMLEIWRKVFREKNCHKIQSMYESSFSRYFHRSLLEADSTFLMQGLVLEHFSFMAMAKISSAGMARSLITYTNAFFKDSDICSFTSPHCLGWYTFMVSNLSPFLCSAFKVIFLSFHMHYWGPCFSAYHDQHIKVT